jgi:hypothetical protein
MRLLFLFTSLLLLNFQEPTKTFNDKDFVYYTYGDVFSKNIVLEHDNSKTKGLDLMFFLAKNTEAANQYKKYKADPLDQFKNSYGETDHGKILRYLGLDNFRRYVVAIQPQNIKVVNGAGGLEVYDIRYPCKADIYAFKGNKWVLQAKQQSFASADKIAAYINAIQP